MNLSNLTNHSFSRHPSLSNLWSPWYDAQGQLLSLPSVEGLRLIGLGFEKVLGSSLGFMTPVETPYYLLSLLALQVTATVILWMGLERIGRKLSSDFASIPYSKRIYVVANLGKSLVLGLQAISPSWWYYSFFHYRCNVDPILKVLGYASLGPCVFDAVPGQILSTKIVSDTYVTTDIAALIIVPKLPTTTVIHHISTTLFLIFVLFTPFHTYAAGQKVMFYGFCSTLAYLVNSFLALRVVNPRAKFLQPLAIVAASIYSLCCAFNWGIHGVWLLDSALNGALSLPILIYLVLVLNLVRDDLILMKWLLTFDPDENATKIEKAKGKKRE